MMMKHFAASNHNIPEAARKILSALHYVDLNLVTLSLDEDESPSQSLGRRGRTLAPSPRFATYQCNDAMISIASSAKDKPVTVTIAKTHENGMLEELLFHFDPIRKTLLTARQIGDDS